MEEGEDEELTCLTGGQCGVCREEWAVMDKQLPKRRFKHVMLPLSDSVVRQAQVRSVWQGCGVDQEGLVEGFWGSFVFFHDLMCLLHASSEASKARAASQVLGIGH